MRIAQLCSSLDLFIDRAPDLQASHPDPDTTFGEKPLKAGCLLLAYSLPHPPLAQWVSGLPKAKHGGVGENNGGSPGALSSVFSCLFL